MNKIYVLFFTEAVVLLQLVFHPTTVNIICYLQYKEQPEDGSKNPPVS